VTASGPNSILGGVDRYEVPEDVLAATVRVLHETGKERHEAFVLWGGVVSADGRVLTVTNAVRPAQTATRSDDGLLVVVDGDALFQINKLFYGRGELLVGQVHTHPGAAYHSSTDDEHPLVTLIGAVSLVIPDFGRNGLAGRERWAWYRLQARGVWHELDPARQVAIV
jgi:hypothetical protein